MSVLSHIPSTSLRCSNQPLWTLNLMTGVNTTEQQTGEIKNKKSNLVELNTIWKQSQKCPGKKGVLIDSCSESCQGRFLVKVLGKCLWGSSFLVKLHYLVPGGFYLRFRRFLYQVNTSGSASESCRLSACSFTGNELLHGYFSRVLTANFRTPTFQNTS